MAWSSSGKKAQETSTSQVTIRGRDSLSSNSVSASNTMLRRGIPRLLKKTHKRVSTPGQDDPRNSEEGGYLKDEAVEDVQQKVLNEVKKINTRLNVVEEQVAGSKSQGRRPRTDKLSTGSKASVSACKNNKCNLYSDSSESSDDDLDLPELSSLRSSKSIQKRINKAVAGLQKQQVQGNDQNSKIKSKRRAGCRGRGPESSLLAHEHILGGQIDSILFMIR